MEVIKQKQQQQFMIRSKGHWNDHPRSLFLVRIVEVVARRSAHESQTNLAYAAPQYPNGAPQEMATRKLIDA